MKTDIRRKLLCLFLVLTMLVSVCPVAAFAEDITVDAPAVEDLFDGPEDPVDEPEDPADEPEDPAEEPEEPAKEPEDPAEEPEEPAEEPEEPAEEPKEPAEEPKFPGLPEGYALTDEQLEIRENMIAHGEAAELEGLVPDVDYIEGQVWFLADTEEQAQLVAEAYGAELISYAFEVGVLRLKEGVTAAEAVAAAEDLTLNLPPVSADFIVELEPEPEEEVTVDNSAQSSYSWLSRKSWAYWRDYYSSDFDPFLLDPSATAENGSLSDMHYQYMHDMVHSYSAWGVTMGEGVLVAVLDTGVAAHEDLPSIARVKVASYDEGDNPTNSHGTHVGGIIGARLGNSLGGAGIAPEVSLLSIQVLNGNGSGSNSVIVSGINAARLYGGVDVVNMSLGGKYYDSNYEVAIQKLIDAGISLVVSSGNDNSNVANYPGTFEIPGLICVGSVTRGRAHAGYSNFGPWVDIWAPGSDIWSTVPGNSYGHKNGTSMATPVVTGAVALYMARYGHTDPVTMEKIIKASVTDGVLDTAKFFEKDSAPTSITVEGLAKNTAPYGAKLSFSVEPGDTILYTLDGSKPGIGKDGYPTSNCKYYDPSSPIYLNADAGAAIGKKITINALRISGFGVTCKNASLSLTVGYANPTKVKVTAPTYLIPGKSVTLTASVEPSDSADQSVVWEIVKPQPPSAPGATLKAGKLSTKATDTGVIRIRAKAAAKPSITSDVISIPLENLQPVKKLVLMRSGEPVTKATLNYIDSWHGAESMVLEPVALDASGNPIEGLHFSWVSSAPDVATVEKDGTVQALKPGKATITCTALDGSNVSAKCAVTVQQAVTGLSLGGPYSVAPGKAVTLQPTLYPADAAVKKLDWRVDDASASKGVTVSNGKVSAPKTIANGTVITVTATATDGFGTSNSCKVIVEASVNKVAIYLDDENPDFYGGGWEKNKDGSLKSITLFSVEQDYYEGGSKSWVDSYARLYTEFDIATDASVIWTSSNENVVSVYDGMIYAVGAGSATVTAKVADAGGKSAKVTVKVINPASSVTVVSGAPALNTDSSNYEGIPFDRLLGVGKSVSNKAVVGDAFGKPTNAKVTWSYSVSVYNSSGSHVSSLENLIYDNKLIKLSNSGAVSASAKLGNYVNLSSYDVFVKVTAYVTGDGTWVEGSCTYWVVPLATKVGASSSTVTWDSDLGAFVVPLAARGNPWAVQAFNVTSSNPKAGTAKISSGKLLLYYNNRDLTKVGKFEYTTVKVTTCDGSGKSASFNVGFRLNASGTYTVTFKSYPRA